MKRARAQRKPKPVAAAALRPARRQQPIELYYWPTPNGWKVSIMLDPQ